jgi:hypothetical protein
VVLDEEGHDTVVEKVELQFLIEIQLLSILAIQQLLRSLEHV